MKTKAELFSLIAQAVIITEESHKCGIGPQWFVHFSGHVNKLCIDYYFGGWSTDRTSEKIEVTLDEVGTQAAYWFIQSKLTR